jgi:hypothetical protein
MRRFDSLLVWMAGLADATPRWLRTVGPLLGAIGVPLTLCLFFVILPTILERQGLSTTNPFFAAAWLAVSILALVLAALGALFAILLALTDPPANLKG